MEVLVTLLLCVACAAGPTSRTLSEPAPKSPAEPMPAPRAEVKKTMQTRPIDADLVKWMRAEAGKRSLEVPLRFESKFDVDQATVSHGDVSHELFIDSTALSMTLDMHLSNHCSSFPCTVWVRGSWGPLMGEPPPEGGPAIFTVREVLGPVEGSPEAIRIGA